MGYYMRFYDTAKKPLTLRSIRTALRRHDRLYELDIPTETNPQHGTLRYAGTVYAEIDVSEPGDGIFEGEIAEMLEAVVAIRSRTKAAAKDLVAETLRAAKRSVIVCLRFGTKEVEATLERIDPLWDWLHDTRTGLLQADDEGFYDDDGLLLPLK